MNSRCDKIDTCSFYRNMAENPAPGVREMIDHYCHNRINAQQCVRILVQQIYEIDPSTVLGPSGVVSSPHPRAFKRAS